MSRFPEDDVALALLHDPPQIHHTDPVADMANNRQIMGNEEVGRPPLSLQPQHQVDDLRADRHIESGDRLVRDNERRVDDHRTRDAYSLALAPKVAALGEHALIPAEWHQPLRQHTAPAKSAGPVAARFYAYAREPAARAIFRKRGFALPVDAP